jgi:hypothetical protein
MQDQADLLQVVRTLHTCSGLAHPSGRRHEQRDENRDDGDAEQDVDELAHG